MFQYHVEPGHGVDKLGMTQREYDSPLYGEFPAEDYGNYSSYANSRTDQISVSQYSQDQPREHSQETYQDRMIDDIHLDTLLLSDILKTSPKFSFFEELINIKSIESAQTLLYYDLVKINNSIVDISAYLKELILLLENLDNIANNNSPLNRYYDNIDWIYEGKSEFTKIFKNVEGVDSIISQLLHIIESKLDDKTNDEEFFDQDLPQDESDTSNGNINGHNSEKKRLEYLHLLTNFDEISELSLHVKKYLISYKSRVEIAEQFNVLYNQVLDSINDEIDSCLKDSFDTHELKFSQKPVNSYDMKKTLEKIDKILSTIKSDTEYSRRSRLDARNFGSDFEAPSVLDNCYPIFEDEEKNLYDHLTNLKAAVVPMKASIEYVKPQISMYVEKEEIREFYPTSIDMLNEKFEKIEEKYIFLLNDLDDLKYELVEKKWSEYFFYLFNRTNANLSEVLTSLQTLGILSENQVGQIDKHTIIPIEVEQDIKLIQSCVHIMERAVNEKLIQNSQFELKFGEVLQKWQTRLEDKLPNEIKSEWLSTSGKKGDRMGMLGKLDTTTDHNQIDSRVLKMRARSTMSPKGLVISPVSEASSHTRRTASMGSALSPGETEFQARSFSLSRTNTNNVVSPSIPPQGFSSQNQGFNVVSPVISPVSETTAVHNSNKDNPDQTTPKEPRNIHRRSLTGSMLIGRMNLQPVLVQGTPTSPARKEKPAEKRAVNKIIPRMGHFARDIRVLSTVESVADEDSGAYHADDSALDLQYDSSFESPLKNKSILIPKKNEIDFYNSTITSSENSRLDALKRLEVGEKDNNIDNNILDSLNDLTLDDLQETLQGEEVKSPSSASTIMRIDTKLSKYAKGIPSGQQPKSPISVSRLPVTKNGTLSKKFNIISSPTSDSFADTESHHEISVIESVSSRKGSIASGKSSLTPVPASKVSRIRSPESVNLEFGYDSPETTESDNGATLDRIKKLKRSSDKRTSLIPQPKAGLSKSKKVEDKDGKSSKTKRKSSGRAKIIAKKV